LGLGILAVGAPSSDQILCTSSAPVDAIEETTTSPGGLSYDAVADQYVYVWKTAKTWAGQCRQLVVGLTDGTEHRANFVLK
jgi:hypothetical protein